ncbi:MAG: Protease HtpX, partial [Bacteroidetes bacterium]|nr:Protease HtpX [Bacteroidota bacterium]
MGRQAPNIYEQQAANKRDTVIVMVAFTLFVGLLGYGCDAFLFGTNGMFPIVTILALVVGGASAFSGLQSGSKVVLASAGAQPAAADNPRYRQLHNVVDEMAIASGLPRPNVYVIPDPDPNAFAIGKDPAHASIAITEGLLEKLNRDELQGVIAHEMSHIRNYDIRMMTVVAALAGAVMLLTEFGSRSMRFGGRRRSSGRGGGAGGILLLGLWLLAMVLAPLVSQILAMAVSRQREYLADASGAELTRHPLALAAALEKIDGAIEPTRAIKKGT